MCAKGLSRWRLKALRLGIEGGVLLPLACLPNGTENSPHR